MSSNHENTAEPTDPFMIPNMPTWPGWNFDFGNNKDSDEPKLRLVSVYGEIESELVDEVIAAIRLLSLYGYEGIIEPNPDGESVLTLTASKPIEMIVSSEGGNVLEMFSLYDIIRETQNKGIEIQTTGLGKVMSAAVLLLASGTKGKRRAGKHTRFMLHPPSGGAYGNVEEIETDTKELNTIKRQYVDALCEETNMKRRKVLSLVRRGDTYFNAQQALEWGIIDEII